MKTKTGLALGVALVLSLALPLLAQHGEERRSGEAQRPEAQRPQTQHAPEAHPPRANQGHVPEAPVQRAPHAKPAPERYEGGRINNTPHVNNNQWYGHDRPNDRRYHVGHPFEHGRFEHFGPSYRYNVLRIDPGLHRFWLPGGYYFDIAAWDWALASGWCWTCANDFVVYEDPDHPGWYLLYNLMTGAFVHVMYMGM